MPRMFDNFPSLQGSQLTYGRVLGTFRLCRNQFNDCWKQHASSLLFFLLQTNALLEKHLHDCLNGIMSHGFHRLTLA